MAKHTVKLVQGGSAIIDLQNYSNMIVSGWKLEAYDPKAVTIEDEFLLNPIGSSITAFYDNLDTLGRTMLDGEDNYYQWQNGLSYTPIFLQFKQDGSSHMMQTEWFGANPKAVNNWLSAARRAKVLDALPTAFRRRPYWEETATQSLASSESVSNNGGYFDISGVRGNLPSPMHILVRTATTNQDRIIVAAKARGTVTNFVNKYEAEDYTTRNAAVANLTDANFSGAGAPQGQQWTPANTTATTILTWDITSNISDQLGTYRVFVRCRDNNATFNVAVRVRAGVYTGSNTPQYGDYGSFRKYGDGTGTSGGSNASAGTTAIPLIDCGIIKLPPVDLQGNAPAKMILELEGKAASVSGSPTFDVDCLYLMPLYELPMQSGYVMAKYPIALGNAAAPDGIITGLDRYPRAYLDDAGVVQYGASEIRGAPLYAWNSDTIRVFVLTQRDSNLRHTQNLTNVVTITAMPRYRYPGRGT